MLKYLVILALALAQAIGGDVLTGVVPAAEVSAFNCADATTQCVPSEHGTIDACWEAANDGDTCLVAPGTYAEVPVSTNNGSAGNLITFVANGAVTMCGWQFASNSYIRVIGFTMSRTPCGSPSISLVRPTGTNTFLEFWNNELTGCDGCSAFDVSNWDTAFVSNSIFIGNTVHDIGATVGGGSGIVINGNDNFVAYNNVYDMSYIGYQQHGRNNRWYNNSTHNVTVASGSPDAHPDTFFFGNSGTTSTFEYNLFEASFSIGVASNGDSKFIQYSNTSGNTSTKNVFRRSVVHDFGSGYGINQCTSVCSWFFQYNQTLVENIRADTTTTYNYTTCCVGGATITDSVILNSIFWEAWTQSLSTNIRGFYFDSPTTGTGDYNLGYDPDGSVTFTTPWTSQSNPRSNSNPLLTDVDNDDFTLSSVSSGAFGTAGPITTTSGSGTGSTFSVQANYGGAFFGDNTSISQYGGVLVTGDVLTVGTDTCTVSSISGDAITCAETFTWANNDPVYWGTDTTPDIGAYPYKAGGYTLSATYTNNSGAITVTPNDASLVRFVVCYKDNVPVEVDNSSPFTCSVGTTGVISVRVYKLYPASTALWVVATR